MKTGALFDYTIRWLGLPLSWRTRIAEYAPPIRFVDVQLRGPYRFWRHTHSFRRVEGGTLVADRVDYALPLGAVGRLAHRLAVSSQLLRIFRYRQHALERLLGAGPPHFSSLWIADSKDPTAK
ncbi:MAG: SRPBCC family protein [Bryobacteraceae bacterium]|nr:SRPBCC family protein [Bryobacteraceae bacterium]